MDNEKAQEDLLREISQEHMRISEALNRSRPLDEPTVDYICDLMVALCRVLVRRLPQPDHDEAREIPALKTPWPPELKPGDLVEAKDCPTGIVLRERMTTLLWKGLRTDTFSDCLLTEESVYAVHRGGKLVWERIDGAAEASLPDHRPRGKKASSLEEAMDAVRTCGPILPPIPDVRPGDYVRTPRSGYVLIAPWPHEDDVWEAYRASDGLRTLVWLAQVVAVYRGGVLVWNKQEAHGA